MFIKVIHNVTKEVVVVTELSDYLFQEGYRFVDYVLGSKVDLPIVDDTMNQFSIQQHGF